MALPVTALYAAVLALIMLVLSFATGGSRAKHKISLGDGGHPELLAAIRRHGNAVEYVPMAVILLGLLEANGTGNSWLHGLGAALVVSRIAHPIGLSASRMVHPLRIIGTAGTSLVTVIAAGYALWQVKSVLF
ncbi:MAG: MAPEG family protein [Lysobacterales bacterium]